LTLKVTLRVFTGFGMMLAHVELNGVKWLCVIGLYQDMRPFCFRHAIPWRFPFP